MAKIEVRGKNNSAVVFTENIEEAAVKQILDFCNEAASAGSKIRIMPDVHAGKGCTIGTTMTITDKVVPNLVGVDIGCGMFVIKIDGDRIKLSQLDDVIHRCVPSGRKLRGEQHMFAQNVDIRQLRCYEWAVKPIENRAMLSVGTLGSGNHFIEVAKNDGEDTYLVIHTGSRHLGVAVASYYQKEAWKRIADRYMKARQDAISALTAEGRQREIAETLKKITEEYGGVREEFAYCEGGLLDDYLHDMTIVQEYARWNRRAIANEILRETGIPAIESFETVHNYIDVDSMILRKGAVSAKAGEKLIIPMNMRDGSLICVGKGNPDWNCSAPHGAGRLMSRSEAKKEISLDDFKKSMGGIYTTCVGMDTLDESPMAYKPMEEIIVNIGDTVDIIDVIKPVYNFKAGE